MFRPHSPLSVANTTFASKYPAKILLVEDILVNQKLGLRILAKLGYTPDTACNGVEALDMICKANVTESKDSYDLVFMDIQMPEMDGYQCTEKIFEAFNEKRITKCPTIVALTANVTMEDRNRCLQVGMDDHMTKPVRISSFQHMIAKHLSQRTSD